MRSYVLGALGALTVIVLFLGAVYLFGLPSAFLSVPTPTLPAGANGPPIGAPVGTDPRRVTPGMRLDAPGPPSAPQPTINPTVMQAERERRSRAEATAAAEREKHCRKIDLWYLEHGRSWNRAQGPDLTETEIQMMRGVKPEGVGYVSSIIRKSISEAVDGCYGR